jgi:uncharacterized membrane protein
MRIRYLWLIILIVAVNILENTLPQLQDLARGSKLFLATCTELAQSYYIIQGHYLATCRYWILAEVSSLVVYFMYKFSLTKLSDLTIWIHSFCVITYAGQILIHLAELPVTQSTSILSQQVWTTDWNFLVELTLDHTVHPLFTDRVYCTAIVCVDYLSMHYKVYYFKCFVDRVS